MSIVHHPEDMEVPDVQVWTNAAFDNEESDYCWSKTQDECMSLSQSSESLQTDCGKENLCPSLLKTPASLKYSVPVKPLNPSGVIGNSQGRPLKTPAKVIYRAQAKEISKERNIDAEIEETQKEISRLSKVLKALQIEKAEQNAKTTQMHSRRKSCVSKLQGIDGEKVRKRRGISTSLSPKSRRTMSKVQGVKQPATTVVSRKSVKKGGVLELIPPKKLFMDVEKPLRTGRIVASRYNQTNENSAAATESSKRSSRSIGPESRVKKRWEIPSEIQIFSCS